MSLLEELESILSLKNVDAPNDGIAEDEWDHNLVIYTVACMVESFGQDILTGGVSEDSVDIDSAGDAVSLIMMPPDSVVEAFSIFSVNMLTWKDCMVEILSEGIEIEPSDRLDSLQLIAFEKMCDKVSARGFEMKESLMVKLQEDISTHVEEMAPELTKLSKEKKVDRRTLRYAAKSMCDKSSARKVVSPFKKVL